MELSHHSLPVLPQDNFRAKTTPQWASLVVFDERRGSHLLVSLTSAAPVKFSRTGELTQLVPTLLRILNTI
jgi:hypothetical protein